MPTLSDLGQLPKRLVLGRAVRSDRLGESLLPKRYALPIFASDPLSSVAYATQEILIVLTLAGTAFLYLAPWLAAGVVLLLITVVLSYRQVVHAYPSGGGDYEVAMKNHGQFAGLVVASALLTDYVLTVAVSVSAGTDNIISAFPGLNQHRVLIAVVLVSLLAAANLRGVRESGKAFAAPTYLFITGIGVLIVTGLIRWFFTDGGLVAETAQYTVTPEPAYEQLGGLALLFFALRAFASGCTALTGVEAIANGVPAFRPPKSRNAAATLVLMGGIAATMFAGVTALALLSDVKYVEHPCDLQGFADCETEPQRTVIAQLAAATFGGDTSVGFFYIQAATALVLVLAANTAFNGFPLLGSVLAQDSFMPRQLHTRGDKLVFSNGILLLAGFAILLIVAFDADVTRLIQLYIIGVFTSFSIGQWGMVRHWNREMRATQDPVERRRMRRSQIINTLGGTLTTVVLVIIVITKFTHGAWLVIVAMPILFGLMRAINKHYSHVSAQLVPDSDARTLPSKVHAVVLVSKVHKPTLRALAFARATRPDELTALTVNVDDAETRALQAAWERFDIPVPLTVLESPYREITRPVIDFVKSIRRNSPRELVVVFVPQYVVGHWWENLLHNQSALRLRARLQFQPGVMITTVPWQLESSIGLDGGERGGPAPGDLRRGLADDTIDGTPYG
ncbi:amino acid/polyamine/organocation transporter, APC superfamily [Blastococcus aggregatus]|uniref:Amino acid/polyamine/organocation transporter, APC superfamily n=1 Tax=Blastococcus aggregatus TaxID=38502 RepID=A0A285V7K9_9ACTN|nr:APC family permease [Blastococcus aggregatus]SOC50114.1 amino acid/polyamine/organocation transporter, APC superfamily [Blastococcus aggregatus]